MDKRRRHDQWRQGSDGPRNDTVWDRVSTACAMVLHHVRVDAVAVSIPGRGWGAAVATDLWAERLEEYQHTLGEGPTQDVIQTGLAVLVPDLLAKQHRWPVFAEKAAANNLAAVFAVPVPDANTNPIGALTLYRRTTGPLLTKEVRDAAVMAGFTAKLIELDDDPRPPRPGQDHHSTVATATALLAARHSITPDDAFALLRAHAYAQDRPLHHIAEAVINKGLWSTSLDDEH